MEYYYSTNHLHETPQKEDYIEEAEEEDALSLCDFTFQDEPISSLPQPNLPTSFPSDSDDFEFSIGTEIKAKDFLLLKTALSSVGNPYLTENQLSILILIFQLLRRPRSLSSKTHFV